ncbi:MAG: GNAT family N-acetyltransferase, partial [Cyclobacteriaceae bacterium]
MIIEKAAHKDIPELVNFQKRMAMETEDLELNHEIVTEGIKNLFSDPSKGQYFVVRSENQCTGCLMITYEWS